MEHLVQELLLGQFWTGLLGCLQVSEETLHQVLIGRAQVRDSKIDHVIVLDAERLQQFVVSSEDVLPVVQHLLLNLHVRLNSNQALQIFDRCIVIALYMVEHVVLVQVLDQEGDHL